MDTEIRIPPYHIFRYVSEWDSRKPNKSKGRFLNGCIMLAEGDRDIKSSVAEIVREDKNNKTLICKEPVPNKTTGNRN